MSGLIFGSMLQGLGAAGSTIAGHMVNQVSQDERQRERLEAQRELQADRSATQLAIAGMRNDAKGGGSGGMTDIKEGGLAEETMANRMGMSVPELRALRKANKTGDTSAYESEVELAGPTEDGGALKGKVKPQGLDQYIKAKRAVLADIQSEFMHGKDYDDVAKGRRTEHGNKIAGGIVNGTISAEQGGKDIAAIEGKDLYDGDSNVTRGKFDGKTTTTAVGESQIKENNAQAGKAAAEGAKAKSEGDGKVKPKDVIASIESQRKDIKDKIIALGHAQKAELDAEVNPSKKKDIIADYKAQRKTLEARDADLESQFDSLREKVGLPGKGKPGDNTSIVKSPTAGESTPDISAVKGAPAGSTIGKHDPAKGWEVKDKSGKLIGYVKK
jgi:hypothetical protein